MLGKRGPVGAVAVVGLLVTELLTLARGAAATIYVNGTTGDDAWNGLCETWDGGTCGPKRTIQAGIDAAVTGDTVIVADGTYGGADVGGKGLGIRSASANPDTCIVDCQGSGRPGFYFRADPFGGGGYGGVDGFTIRGGTAAGPSYRGGGVCSEGSSVGVRNCIITGNLGGGVALTGGGDLTNCTVSGNSVAGIYCSGYNTPTVANCRISGNSGKGAHFENGSQPTLTNCTISDNDGSGVYCLWSMPTLVNCTISGNATSDLGGGMHFSASTPFVSNCVVSGNTSRSGGGGAYFYNVSWGTVANCTFSGNDAGGYEGGAVFCYSSSPTFANCILWGDRPMEINAASGSDPVLTHCDLHGGWIGTGWIDADPLFVDPAHTDFRLQFGSPCVDTGDNAGVLMVPHDLAGNPRVARFTVDMGAYEIPFGDLNCDQRIDFGDINPFVTALIGRDVYEQAYPGCAWLYGDLNGDGTVNFDDINPFVRCLVGGG